MSEYFKEIKLVNENITKQKNRKINKNKQNIKKNKIKIKIKIRKWETKNNI